MGSIFCCSSNVVMRSADSMSHTWVSQFNASLMCSACSVGILVLLVICVEVSVSLESEAHLSLFVGDQRL